MCKTRMLLREVKRREERGREGKRGEERGRMLLSNECLSGECFANVFDDFYY